MRAEQLSDMMLQTQLSSPASSSLITPNLSLIQDNLSSFFIGSISFEAYYRAFKTKNSNNVGSKDMYQSGLYISKMFVRTKENKLKDNLLK